MSFPLISLLMDILLCWQNNCRFYGHLFQCWLSLFICGLLFFFLQNKRKQKKLKKNSYKHTHYTEAPINTFVMTVYVYVSNLFRRFFSSSSFRQAVFNKDVIIMFSFFFFFRYCCVLINSIAQNKWNKFSLYDFLF